MDVTRIGQGGQINLDILNKSFDTSEAQPGVAQQTQKEAFEVQAVNNENDPTAMEEKVKKAVDKLNKFLEDNGTHAEYSVHEKFKDIMIKIVDDKTKEVVLEIPPKKILDMVAKMIELVGVLVDKKA